jgi:hypothetical protein
VTDLDDWWASAGEQGSDRRDQMLLETFIEAVKKTK